MVVDQLGKEYSTAVAGKLKEPEYFDFSNQDNN